MCLQNRCKHRRRRRARQVRYAATAAAPLTLHDRAVTTLLRAFYDVVRVRPEPTFGPCHLADGRVLYALADGDTDARLQRAFRKACALVPGVELSRFNLFHAHVVLPAAASAADARVDRLVYLFHAFEYPADVGQSLGFCQRGSTLSVRHPNFRRRNLLLKHADATESLQILPCAGRGACTVYAEELGLELGQVFFLPDWTNVWFQPALRPTAAAAQPPRMRTKTRQQTAAAAKATWTTATKRDAHR
jgi:hypothetical protein